MGRAVFGSGMLKSLDVPGAIDLFMGFLDHLGDREASDRSGCAASSSCTRDLVAA